MVRVQPASIKVSETSPYCSAGSANPTDSIVKLFNTNDCPTQTYTSTTASPPGSGETDGFKWHARVSKHSDLSYEQFKMGLLENHSPNEREYIEDCKKAERTQVIKEGEMESESLDISRIR